MGFAYTSFALVVLVAAYGFFKASLPSRFYLGISFVYSSAFLAVPVMLRGIENFLARQGFNLNGSRYTVVPILFLVLVVLLALEEPEPRLSGETWRKVQYAFALLAFALVTTNYSNFAGAYAGPFVACEPGRGTRRLRREGTGERPSGVAGPQPRDGRQRGREPGEHRDPHSPEPRPAAMGSRRHV